LRWNEELPGRWAVEKISHDEVRSAGVRVGRAPVVESTA
jgi:hypothetical protein